MYSSVSSNQGLGSPNSDERFFDRLKWLNSEEAASYIRRSVGQLRNMVYRGQIRARKLQGRLLFSRRELDRLIESSSC